jgi:hypothetical protein
MEHIDCREVLRIIVWPDCMITVPGVLVRSSPRRRLRQDLGGFYGALGMAD